MPTISPFHVMVKPPGAICSLDCEYCFYLDKEELYPDSSFRMSAALLEVLIRQYIRAQPGPEISFGWQGGEPTLMSVGFFGQAVKLQQQYQRPGTRITNVIQTNGVTLDEDWCRFFAEHNFLVGVSLDGPRQLHNAYRVDKGGRPTFERVMEGITLLKKHDVDFNILTTVNAANAAYPLEVYRFLRDQVGTAFMQFIPIVECAPDGDGTEGSLVTERSVAGQQWGQFLIAIFDEWFEQDVGEVYVQIFGVALAAWADRPVGLCVFEETCGQALAMEHKGDLYSCDHFVDPEHRLGNITDVSLVEMVGSEQQREFGLAKRDTLPRYCRECSVRFVCNGGCPKNRLLRTLYSEPGLSHLCEGYKAFFTHIDEPMQTLAAALNQ